MEIRKKWVLSFENLKKKEIPNHSKKRKISSLHFSQHPALHRLAQADFPCRAQRKGAHLTSVKSQWRDAKRIVSRRVESREGQAPE